MTPKTKIRKVTRGIKKTSDFIDYDKALLKGRELLWNDKKMIIGFYIIFSINTGLRVGDVLQIKHSELVNLNQGDYLTIREQKTGKTRKIQINNKIVDAYNYLSEKLKSKGLYQLDDFIFKSQKDTVFATVSINRILKDEFAGYARNISTHSLRKSFGRRVYDSNKRSEHALLLLSDIFCHASIAITRRYLGLRQEEIDGVYMAL
jgi:site-specific recombinase XerD